MQEFGFCNLTCVPVRAEASDRSEMVNQLLFGETFEIIDAIKSWKLIRTSHDKYEGFIDEKQYLPISEQEYLGLSSDSRKRAKELSWVTDESGNKIMVMPASIPGGYANGKIDLDDQTFADRETKGDIPEAPTPEQIVESAKIFLGAPYLWGGRSITGIDCSGLVQSVFLMHGIALNRDSSYQARQGETINLISEARPGDLAFFDNEEGEIIHVGIILEAGKIIHASGKVRLDELDHNGIFNKQLKKYTHKLRLIKRIV
jgi:cell wall-associated NlpC family hydrolase